MLENLDKYKDSDGEIIWTGIQDVFYWFDINRFANPRRFVIPEYSFGFLGFHPSPSDSDKMIGKLVWGIKDWPGDG